MEKRSFHKEKISGRKYILETSAYSGSCTYHINVCLVTEKNITVIMVRVWQETDLKKIINHDLHTRPTLESWSGVDISETKAEVLG